MSYEQKLELYNRFVERYSRLPTENDPDYLEMLRMTKYRILACPNTQPGKCANCGASKDDGRKYIDFGLQVDWYGTVHLCGHCTKDIAENMGLFDELRMQIAELQDAQVRVTDLQEQGDQLHDTVVKTFEELKEFYVSIHPTGTDNSSNSDSGVVTNKTESDESGSNESKSATTKPPNVSGRKDVRQLADLLNLSD
jgi:hypothetical protein